MTALITALRPAVLTTIYTTFSAAILAAIYAALGPAILTTIYATFNPAVLATICAAPGTALLPVSLIAIVLRPIGAAFLAIALITAIGTALLPVGLIAIILCPIGAPLLTISLVTAIAGTLTTIGPPFLTIGPVAAIGTPAVALKNHCYFGPRCLSIWQRTFSEILCLRRGYEGRCSRTRRQQQSDHLDTHKLQLHPWRHGNGHLCNFLEEL